MPTIQDIINEEFARSEWEKRALAQSLPAEPTGNGSEPMLAPDIRAPLDAPRPEPPAIDAPAGVFCDQCGKRYYHPLKRIVMGQLARHLQSAHKRKLHG